MYNKLVEKIVAADEIVISGHLRPDGDCFGSQVGMKEAIQATFPDKKVYLSGSGLKHFAAILGTTDEIPDEVMERALHIIVDVNELERVEDQRVKELGKNYILIDHHIKQCEHNFPTLVDTTSCSACEIVAYMIKNLGWKITKAGASGLYMGIVTDSGRFQYINDFAKVFAICSWLCEQKADAVAITNVLALTSEKTIRTKGYFLSHIQKYEHIMYVHLTYDELAMLEVNPGIGSAMINHFGNVAGYPIWATFIDTKEGTEICEFRSNRYPVVEVAKKYGGGGHKLACGVTLRTDIEENRESILKDLAKMMED